MQGSSGIFVAARTHGYGERDGVAEAACSMVRSVTTALDRPHACVRVFVTDPAGKLHLLAAGGNKAGGSPAGRRHALRTGVPRTIRRRGGGAIAVLPLSAAGSTEGVLEVECLDEMGGNCGAILEAAAAEAAVLLLSLRARAELERGHAALTGLMDLARKLVRASSPEEAVGRAVRLLHERLELPMAAWIAPYSGADLMLVATEGLERPQRDRLRAFIRSLPSDEVATSGSCEAVVRRFEAAAGAQQTVALTAGNALIVVGGASVGMRSHLELAAELLADILGHLDEVNEARRRNDQLDFGIAMTAHEFRGPILGTKATLDHLILTSGYAGDQLQLLVRSRRELKLLSDLVEGLLRWSVDAGPLSLEPVSLNEIVEDAVESCRFEDGDGHVVVAAGCDVTINGDARQLKAAISNVVRNAIAYSPRDTTVQVSVQASGKVASVKVRDFGPGIPPGEQDLIFDPFVRGRSGRMTRAGKGLGLFIARRVVEAHHGVIWLDSEPSRTVFHLQFPVAAPQAAAAPLVGSSAAAV